MENTTQRTIPTFAGYFEKAKEYIIDTKTMGFKQGDGKIVTSETLELERAFSNLEALLKRKGEYIKKLAVEGKKNKSVEIEFEQLFEVYGIIGRFKNMEVSFYEYLAKYHNTAIYELASDNVKLIQDVEILKQALESSASFHETLIETLDAINSRK